jgi:DNA-binding HxlR family transcriptional regulator
MKRTTFADWPCSVARTVDLIGDWWTPLVLREAFWGVRRFDVFQRNLGIGRNILTQRLTRLVDEGMLERRPYQDHPPRHEYVLTEKGRDFFPVIAALMRWGDRWLAGDDGPPVVLRHTACDHDTEGEVVCSHCREPLALREVRGRWGPGAPRSAPVRPRQSSTL